MQFPAKSIFWEIDIPPQHQGAWRLKKITFRCRSWHFIQFLTGFLLQLDFLPISWGVELDKQDLSVQTLTFNAIPRKIFLQFAPIWWGERLENMIFLCWFEHFIQFPANIFLQLNVLPHSMWVEDQKSKKIIILCRSGYGSGNFHSITV